MKNQGIQMDGLDSLESLDLQSKVKWLRPRVWWKLQQSLIPGWKKTSVAAETQDVVVPLSAQGNGLKPVQNDAKKKKQAW